MKFITIKKGQMTALAMMTLLSGFGDIQAATDSLQLNYKTTVAPICSVTHTNNTSISDLVFSSNNTTSELNIELLINCNSPFEYSVTTKNRGKFMMLTESSIANNSDNFDDVIAYDLTFKANLVDGVKKGISVTCSSFDETDASRLCRGNSQDAIAVATSSNASIRIKLEDKKNRVLLAGTYSDTLTLSVTARY